MSTLDAHRTLFNEIDKIEDENAYNVSILLNTLEAEQKRSEDENRSLNEKVKDLHASVTNRHSIITQLQAKLKHAEAENRLNQSKAKAQIEAMKNKIDNLKIEQENERNGFNERVRKLQEDMQDQARENYQVLENRNQVDKELRDRIQSLLTTISEKDDQLNELTSKVSVGHSALKAQKARSDRIQEDLTDRLSSLSKARDEDMINLKLKHNIELDSHKEIIMSREDHIKHLEDKLRQADERTADKLNLARAEFDNKLHEVNCLNKEQAEGLTRIKVTLEEKTKAGFEKDTKLAVRESEIKALSAQLESLKFNLKETEAKALAGQENLKKEFEVERKMHLDRINQMEQAKLRSMTELSKLKDLNDGFTNSLDNNFKNIVEMQERQNAAQIQYHGVVKDSFTKLVRTTQDAMGLMD